VAEHVDIRIEPASDRYDAHDERWLDQVAAFRRELEGSVEGVAVVADPQPNSKGAIDSLILSLTSAGVMTAAAEFFKAWIGRAASRRVKVSFGDGGDITEFEFAGSDLDDATLHQVTDALAARLKH
jgi:Effector Associated Constant Component 1